MFNPGTPSAYAQTATRLCQKPVPFLTFELPWSDGLEKRLKVLIGFFQRNKRTEEEAEGRKKGKAILSLSNSNLYWPKKSPDITFVLQKYTKDNIYPPEPALVLPLLQLAVPQND